MIIRVQHEENPFTLIRKSSLEDNRLSFKARGILAYLIGKPNHWTVRVQDLVNQGTDGATAVRSGLNELRKFGYMVRRLHRGADGKIIRTEVAVYETPQHKEDSDCTEGFEEDTTPPLEDSKSAINAHENRKCGFPHYGQAELRATAPLVSNEVLASNEVRVAPPSGADRSSNKKSSEENKSEKTEETRGSKFDPLPGYQTDTPKVAVSDANGFTFPDQEEQPQQKSPTVKAAEELHKQLLARRKVMRPPNIQKWAESFRKLLLESDLGITRFEKVLYWYVQHIDEDDYMPAAYSAQTFCDKFLTIERQMQMRCKGAEQDDAPVPQGIIVKGTKESYEAYRKQMDEDDKGPYWEEIKNR